MGVFEAVFQALSVDADFENISIDSTSCKVHQSANGGEKTENKAVGVSRGGRNTKIHALVDGLGNPLAFLLSSGNDHDSKHAIPLLSQIDIEGSNILGDKAYGAKAIRDYIDSQEASYTIPPKSDVSDPWTVDWFHYTTGSDSIHPLGAKIYISVKRLKPFDCAAFRDSDRLEFHGFKNKKSNVIQRFCS